MVIVLLDHVALTPAGRPFAPANPSFDIPVAPVVVCVIVGFNVVLIHKVGILDAELAVMLGVTVIVPVAFTVPHPPVKGML
jgi:hypothetical protein